MTSHLPRRFPWWHSKVLHPVMLSMTPFPSLIPWRLFRDAAQVSLSMTPFHDVVQVLLSMTLSMATFPWHSESATFRDGWCFPWRLFRDAPQVSFSVMPFHDVARLLVSLTLSVTSFSWLSADVAFHDAFSMTVSDGACPRDEHHQPGPCNSVGMRPRTDRHTDACDHNTFLVVYDSREM